MGFFSAILRILKAMAVGALMLPRIDHSVMPDGFQRFDRGNQLELFFECTGLIRGGGGS